jgi:hypothetical protein
MSCVSRSPQAYPLLTGHVSSSEITPDHLSQTQIRHTIRLTLSLGDYEVAPLDRTPPRIHGHLLLPLSPLARAKPSQRDLDPARRALP